MNERRITENGSEERSHCITAREALGLDLSTRVDKGVY